MTDIKDNPPPLPPYFYGREASPNEKCLEINTVIQIRDESFARGVAAVWAEKDLLVEELQSALGEWLDANEPGGWIDELRTKLRTLEEQKPKAWGMPTIDGTICDCITPGEHSREEGWYTVPLYVAAGAKS